MRAKPPKQSGTCSLHMMTAEIVESPSKGNGCVARGHILGGHHTASPVLRLGSLHTHLCMVAFVWWLGGGVGANERLHRAAILFK
jgi:hypothetical protein